MTFYQGKFIYYLLTNFYLINYGKVKGLEKSKGKEKINEYPSLYDAFRLGDRVVREYKDKLGKNKEYKGIVLAINEKNMEIYWDTLDGKYRPSNMDVVFTNCNTSEIFKGSKEYSPIRKYSNQI